MKPDIKGMDYYVSSSIQAKEIMDAVDSGALKFRSSRLAYFTEATPEVTQYFSKKYCSRFLSLDIDNFIVYVSGALGQEYPNLIFIRDKKNGSIKEISLPTTTDCTITGIEEIRSINKSGIFYVVFRTKLLNERNHYLVFDIDGKCYLDTLNGHINNDIFPNLKEVRYVQHIYRDGIMTIGGLDKQLSFWCNGKFLNLPEFPDNPFSGCISFNYKDGAGFLYNTSYSSNSVVVILGGGPTMKFPHLDHQKYIMCCNGFSVAELNARGNREGDPLYESAAWGKKELTINDYESGINILESKFNFKNIYLLTYSADGFFAMESCRNGFASKHFKKVISCCGMIDKQISMKDEIKKGYNISRISDYEVEFLGASKPIGIDNAAYEDFIRRKVLELNEQISPLVAFRKMKSLPCGTPPILLIHAEDDENVGIEQSLECFESLKKLSANVKLLTLKSGGHYFLTEESARESISAIVRFITIE